MKWIYHEPEVQVINSLKTGNSHHQTYQDDITLVRAVICCRINNSMQFSIFSTGTLCKSVNQNYWSIFVVRVKPVYFCPNVVSAPMLSELNLYISAPMLSELNLYISAPMFSELNLYISAPMLSELNLYVSAQNKFNLITLLSMFDKF